MSMIVCFDGYIRLTRHALSMMRANDIEDKSGCCLSREAFIDVKMARYEALRLSSVRERVR